MALSGFTVYAAVDFGYKANFELTFPYRPTLPELRERIERDLGAECAARCPGRPFEVYRAQVFDERLQSWADIMSPTQLQHLCQIYVFQRETSSGPRDTPGRIPPPIRPEAACGMPYSPPPASRHAAAHHRDPFPLPGDAPSLLCPPRSPSRSHGGTAHHEKVRLVHHELSRGSVEGVRSDDWTDGFETLRLCGGDAEHAPPFTSATASDLFERADLDKDGLVTLAEFARFAEHYPKLLDSLYFRFRERQAEEQRKEEDFAARGTLADMELAVDDARRAADTAGNLVEEAKRRGEAATRDCEAAGDRERDAQRDRDAAAPQREDAQRRAQAARGELLAAKDKVRQHEQQTRGLQRAAEQAEKRLRQREDDRDKSARELERLQRLLEAAQRDHERREADVQEAADEASAARQRADDARDTEADRAVEAAEAALRQAEDEVKAESEADAERARKVRDAQRAVHQAKRAREEASRAEAQCRHREQQRRQAADRAEAALKAQRLALERQEAEAAEREARRKEQERQENELLQLEVRLRVQREAVEAKEAHLSSAHREFTDGAGRSSPLGAQRGLSVHSAR
eukprot:TRINITY_DN3762_c0_g2_i1.p1 TRINITY_DN3762_c0_g2~~TRINITY_DN3762_c0_g2_i1.p1  ORF type:complete len:576 (+),score=207.75 TRINITY_DN3762_c0_g2_i1:98-1825(+)